MCGDDVAAGTATWWDDDRRQATCTTCFDDAGAPAEGRVVPDRVARRARLRRLANA
jgi:hypothetical protein